MEDKLVSICIPAYNKPHFVRRCLDSISRQDYKNVEVILSDDSPGEDTKVVADAFPQLRIKYMHNKPPLKSPANWNAAINKASGAFFMLMHQDDWFETPASISGFVACFADPAVGFAFCRNTGKDATGHLIRFREKGSMPDLANNANKLLLRNVIGPPSNVMLRKGIPQQYDEDLVWLVDVDYYMRILKNGFKYKYIDAHLVTIGLHADQTTEAVRSNGNIVFKENVVVARKIGEAALRDVKLYDYYWRLIRNFRIVSLSTLPDFDLSDNDVPAVLKKMIVLQGKISLPVLKTGFFSKSLMMLSYLRWIAST